MRPAPERETQNPAVAALVLAAGESRRMAPRNKLLIPDASGRAMVARVVDAVLASRAAPVLVVLGHQADAVREALAGRPVQFVRAAEYAAGLSASLKAGLAALPAASSAVLVCLGDMPLVSAAVLDRLVAVYAPDQGRRVVVPSFAGKWGNPVLWDRSFFADILTLTGDVGARRLLDRHRASVTTVALTDDAVLRDFDTPEALAALPQA